MTKTISSFNDLIDVRDIIERFEELETLAQDDDVTMDDDDREEYRTLGAFLEDLKGSGGDEQWRGDWYPVTLIRDSYFTEYAMELVDDIGAIDANAGWPMSCIDWDKASRELQMDYSTAEFDGVTYWFR